LIILIPDFEVILFTKTNNIGDAITKKRIALYREIDHFLVLSMLSDEDVIYNSNNYLKSR